MSTRSLLSYLFAFALLQACSPEAKKVAPRPAPIEDPGQPDDDEKPGEEKPGEEKPDGEENDVVTISVSPATASLAVNATRTFTATVAGADDKTVTWSVVEAAGGSVSSTGLYTAPGAAGTYHVKATSKADTTKSATATITVSVPVAPGVSVVVSPGSSSVLFGDQISFSAVVNNTTDQNVTWSVDENNGGNINANTGVYTAPNNAGTFTVRATSDFEVTQSDTATVTVSAPPAPLIEVWVTPRTAAIYPGDTVDFNVDVTNANNQVAWTATGGTINNGGTYTAGNTPGTFTVTATSDHDAAAVDQVTVTILNPTFNVHITPLSASVETGGTTTFSATVDANTFGNPVTWYSTAGNIGGNGGFTAPLTVGPVQIVATSKDEPTKKATVTVNVVAASPVITITPLGSQVPETDSTYAFTVVVSNSIWNRFTVTLREGDAGALSVSSGAGSGVILYTTPETEGTYHIDAKTVNLPAQTASTTVTVGAPHPFVNLSPLAITIETASSFDFDGGVTGSTFDGFAWSVVSADGGVIDQDGNYTAPVTAGTYIIKIASTKTDAFKTAFVTVYQDVCPVGAKDIVFSSQGPDGQWDGGLDDDTTLRYTRYYYESGKDYARIGYDSIGGGWNEYPAQDVTMAVEYSDPGSDGRYRTTDDTVTGIWKLKYDGSNRLVWYAAMVSGPDAKLGTADDVTGPGAILTDFFVNSYQGASITPGRYLYFTSMSGATLQNHEIYQIDIWSMGTDEWCSYYLDVIGWGCNSSHYRQDVYTGPGPDLEWGNGDDTLAYYIDSYPPATWDASFAPWAYSKYENHFRTDYRRTYNGGYGNGLITGLESRTYNTKNRNYSNVVYGPSYDSAGGNYTSSYERSPRGKYTAQSRLRACPY